MQKIKQWFVDFFKEELDEVEKIIIYKEKIPSTDPRLGRHINHDSRSLNFPLDTSNLSIINVKHDRFIPVLNQGNVGSCTGNAGIGSISSAPFFNSDNAIYSRDENGALKLYSDAEKIDGGIGYPPEDVGSSGLSIAQALKTAGLIQGYNHTFTLDDALKAGSVYPFITGINWYSDMFNPDPDGRVHITGTLAGGHEVVLSEIDKDNGKIWFWNSWGEVWGLGGRFYLTWADYATLLSQRGDVTVLIPNPQPDVVIQRLLKLTNPMMRGNDVKDLQTKLNNLSYNVGIIDGIFGSKTQKAVIDFQTANKLLVDGIVGKNTWNALNNIPSTSKIDLWCEAIKQMEGAKPERNNPGNLRYVGQAYAVNDNGFCKFDTYQHGYDTLKNMLISACTGKMKVYNPDMTLYEFEAVYAPSSDGNNPNNYAEFVAKFIGVSPTIMIKYLL